MKIHMALLAAGQSLRYGMEDKLPEQVGGRNLLSNLLFKIRRIQQTWKGNTLIVTSEERSRWFGTSEIVIINPYPERGISYSLGLAIREMVKKPEWETGDAICFFVCDQPFLKTRTIEDMINGFIESEKGIGCIAYKGPKNPCVFREKYFKELSALTGDTGGKCVLNKHLEDVFLWPAAKEEVWDMDKKKTVVIRGGGDLASGTAYLLHKSGYRVLVLETKKPACIRRQVAFCQAVYDGECEVEGVHAKLVQSQEEAEKIWNRGEIPVLVDEACNCLSWSMPLVVVDAILAKRNLGTKKDMAPLTIGLGPGFTAGDDVDVVIETMRGDSLGQIYDIGSAIPDTGIPGMIAGYGKERVIHAPCDGQIVYSKKIGEMVKKGEVIAKIGGTDIFASITGILRGAIHEDVPIKKGLKIMDIDPRADDAGRCFLISDKAKTIGESVKKAIRDWETSCCGN